MTPAAFASASAALMRSSQTSFVQGYGPPRLADKSQPTFTWRCASGPVKMLVGNHQVSSSYECENSPATHRIHGMKGWDVMLSRTLRLTTIMVLAVVLPTSMSQDQEPVRRHFRMGFTGFPYDYSLEAVQEARNFSHKNADIIAHHIEGVPWAELLAEKPFSGELLNEWNGKKEATPKGGKVYLAISPGRGTLKEGEKSLPFPKELRGKSYDDPAVMKAYLQLLPSHVGDIPA